MSVVWKYDLPVIDDQVVEMPSEAELLYVGSQDPLVSDEIQLWALVNPFMPLVQRRIFIHGTGHAVHPDGPPYVGTVIVAHGLLVWHVFDGGPA